MDWTKTGWTQMNWMKSRFTQTGRLSRVDVYDVIKMKGGTSSRENKKDFGSAERG